MTDIKSNDKYFDIRVTFLSIRALIASHTYTRNRLQIYIHFL